MTESSPVRPLGPASAALLVFLGGAMGSLLRFMVSEGMRTAPLDAGNTVANLVGSFVMGVLVTWLTLKYPNNDWIRPLFMVGLLGGFTTFSGSILAIVHAMAYNDFASALLIFFVNVFCSVLACAGGAWLVSRMSGSSLAADAAAQPAASANSGHITARLAPVPAAPKRAWRLGKPQPLAADPGGPDLAASDGGTGVADPAASAAPTLVDAEEGQISSPTVRAFQARLEAEAAGDYVDTATKPHDVFVERPSGRRARPDTGTATPLRPAPAEPEFDADITAPHAKLNLEDGQP
ncbi:CrcB family protein [Micrococcales bacterium 31B]|nr:CrcB family protein [Micrococcales bacterium 31B]